MKQTNQETALTIEINTVQDVRDFFRLLRAEFSLVLHPDNPFEDYIKPDKTRVFSDSQATTLNSKMQRCFAVCEANGEDIYLVGWQGYYS